MKSKIFAVFFVALMVAAVAAPARAQYGQPPRRQSQSWGMQNQEHRVEIFGYGGYAWTGAIDAWYGTYSGELDITDSGIWGIEADITMRPDAQLVLLYSRQESEAVFQPRPVDEQILQDKDPNYRVLDVTVSTFQSAQYSYFHKMIGQV